LGTWKWKLLVTLGAHARSNKGCKGVASPLREKVVWDSDSDPKKFPVWDWVIFLFVVEKLLVFPVMNKLLRNVKLFSVVNKLLMVFELSYCRKTVVFI
ncbi:hypothetical protein, partial [Escherichia coli]|uniref:hypothetical protein n=1 Tax=Escherichia coli TaxID=562 RepID=UPI001BFC6773